MIFEVNDTKHLNDFGILAFISSMPLTELKTYIIIWSEIYCAEAMGQKISKIMMLLKTFHERKQSIAEDAEKSIALQNFFDLAHTLWRTVRQT